MERSWNAVFTGPWSSIYSGQGSSGHVYSYYHEPTPHSQPSPQLDRPPQPSRESCYLPPREPATQSQPSPQLDGAPQPPRESARSREQGASYSYDVKIINPKKKSDFVVRRWHGVTEVIRSPAVLKVKLHESFPHDVPAGSNLQVGYLEGNHKRWIFEERDLGVMYDSFEPGSKITLWCDGINADNSEPSAKRRKTATTSVTANKSTSEATDNVDQIFKELKSKHSDMENTKLRLWAKLIDKGRYDDVDNPPQIPLITGSPAPAKKKRDNISNALVDAATVVAKAFQTSHTPTTVATDSPTRSRVPIGQLEPPSKLSPLKYAQLRRSCLEDLKSLKDLYQENILSEAEFTEEKARILSTLKTLQ